MVGYIIVKSGVCVKLFIWNCFIVLLSFVGWGGNLLICFFVGILLKYFLIYVLVWFMLILFVMVSIILLGIYYFLKNFFMLVSVVFCRLFNDLIIC